MQSDPKYFLGANSCAGFYSLYESFIEESKVRNLFILKGGAGCGKSSFMRAISSALSDEGYEVEQIVCSGDPGSLDGIYVPKLSLMYVDGTAPHVIEPVCAGILGNYINLGEFYELRELEPQRDKILGLHRAYKSKYRRAYALLSASGESLRGVYAELLADSAYTAVDKRASGIISREIKKSGKSPGSVSRRFYRALCCEGRIDRLSIIDSQYSKKYILDTEYGLGSYMLGLISEAATARGYDVLQGLSPLLPDRLTELLIPELSLAFITRDRRYDYEGSGRRLHLDSLVDGAKLKELRGRLKSENAVIDEQLRCAVVYLSEAKALHDELEKAFNPHVDFGGVYDLAIFHGRSVMRR